MWDGVERADSLVLNPHKWLGAAFDCSVYFVRDAEHLVRVMSTNPSYLQTAADGQVKNYRDWGIPLGRRFRALKLWFLDPRAGRRGDCRRGCAATWRTRGGWRSRSRSDARLARARAGAAADRLRPPRAATGWRATRSTGTRWPGRSRQPLRPRLPDAGDARRPLDGPRLDRRELTERATRRGAVGADAGRGGTDAEPDRKALRGSEPHEKF